ncbi:MAG: hypothetical protein EHM35_00565 [Planctomycetaceae bacterium]|nr:MAG: hypothetical protein EHM35_00565 [Planctomycetaceae bacterium]
MKRWAIDYDECQNCHSPEHPHKGSGLCVPCYYRQYKRPKPSKRRDLYTRGYDDGLQDGIDRAIHAAHALLRPHGGSFRLDGEEISIEIQGATLTGKV